jgi:hypothetical protein
MAAPLKIRVDVDMDQLVRAARDAGMSAEDLSAAFTDVSRESAKADTTATRALSDIDREAADAAAGVSKVGDAATPVSGALSGIGDAAKSALSGDVEGAADGAISALGGMAEAIPGIGGLVGGALATAVAAWIAHLDLFNQRTAEIKGQVASALVEVGGAFTAADLESRLQAVVNDTDQWKAANTIAQATGMSLSDTVRALAGDTDLAAEAYKRFTAAAEQGINENTGPAAWMSRTDLLAATQALDGVTQGLQEGADKARVVTEAIRGTKAETAVATDKLNAYNRVLKDLPKIKETKVRVTADTSQLDSAISKYDGRRIGVRVGIGERTWQ